MDSIHTSGELRLRAEHVSATLLRRRFLWPVRLAWMLIVLLSIAIFLAGVPYRFERLHLGTTGILLSEMVAGEYVIESLDGGPAAEAGIRSDETLVTLDNRNVRVGALRPAHMRSLLRGRIGDELDLVVRSTDNKLREVTIGIRFLPEFTLLRLFQDEWHRILDFIYIIGAVSSLAFFFVFPTGRFMPRRSYIVLLAWILWTVFTSLVRYSPANPYNAAPVQARLVDLTIFLTGISAQVYRYKHTENLAQRQQKKWVVYGLIVAVGTYFAYMLPYLLWPTLNKPGLLSFSFQLIGFPIFAFSLAMVPIFIGVSILRFRLWDVDILINRTLVYGTLTGLLVSVYAISVIGLQNIHLAVTGHQSSVRELYIGRITVPCSSSPRQATGDR